MAITYQLIQGYTLTGTQSSITFSSIPQTYTDLVVVGTLRDTANVGVNSPQLRINGLSTSIYGNVRGAANNGTASSASNSSQSQFDIFSADPGSGVTSNTFSNFQIYFASYRVGLERSFNYFNTLSPNSNSDSYINMASFRFDGTTAISSLTLYGGSFATGSTLDLYGILEF